MAPERLTIIDTSLGAIDLAGEVRRPGFRRRRPTPRLLVVALVLTTGGGLLEAQSIYAAQVRSRDADTHVAVTVTAADAGPAATVSAPVSVEAAVSLVLSASVPVRVVAVELDGAPPVMGQGAAPPTRTPRVAVRWRVLCAEVGTIPGPRLIDLHLRTASGDQQRRIRLDTSDADPIAQVFRLRAAAACDVGRG